MKERKIYYDAPKKNPILLEGISYANNPDYRTLKCGNINFNDDNWDLKQFTFKTINVYICSVSFDRIPYFEFKNTVKQYAWYLIGNATTINKLQTVQKKIEALLAHLIPYIKEKKITSLKEFNKTQFRDYIEWLKVNAKAKGRQSHLSPQTLCNKCTLLQELVEVAIKNDWDDAPQELLTIGQSMRDYWGVKKRIEFTKNLDKSVPEHILKKIIDGIAKENDIIASDDVVRFRKLRFYADRGMIRKPKPLKPFLSPWTATASVLYFDVNIVKFVLQILYGTGIRISEVLSLDRDCAWKEESYFGTTYYLNRVSSKTEPEPRKRKIIISKETYDCVQKARALTNQIMLKMGSGWLASKRLLFRVKNAYMQRETKDLVCIQQHEFSYQLKKFMERHNITYINKHGQEVLYPLHPHQFRHTFAQKLVNDGVPLRIIKRHYAHVSVDMTIHYAKIKEETLEKDYIKTYLNADTIYSSGSIGDDFKKMIENIRTVKDLDEVMSSLSKRFGINPLPMGMCLLDFKKGHCSNTGSEGCYYIGCKDFVTNTSFLPNFKQQKALIDKEITRLKDNKFAIMNLQVNTKKREKLEQIITSLETKGAYIEGNTDGKE